MALLTFADIIGFGPTFRRAYHSPDQENARFFALGAFCNFLVVLAFERYSWATTLFPAAVGAACLVLACLLYVRRVAMLRHVEQAEITEEV